MPQDHAASVQGVAIRVTRLDGSGNLLNGSSDSYTTSAFIRTSFTPEYEEGDEITEKAADGTVCVSFKAPDTLKRVNLEIAICNPDPELSALLSGGLMLSGPKDPSDLTGVSPEIVQGWASAQVGEDPSGNGVAVEVWSRAIQNGKPANYNPFFRWVFPYVKTRLSGDRVIENGLLATTFEGFGLGNINFRSGIDESWRWPAATDRPYLYAREAWAPTGLNGFYTWAAKGANAALGGLESAVSDDLSVNTAKAGGLTGINVPGGANPYPYNSGIVADFVLSSEDYVKGEKQDAVAFPASAAANDVFNESPNVAGAADNTVTYLTRSDATAPSPGYIAITDVTAGTPGAFVPPNATLPADLTALKADPAIGDTAKTGDPAWTTGQYIVLGDASQANWSGTTWEVGVG
jgi:hypothetical protein